ncbi:MAG: hypothetical protein P857_706 [Candidatus Xenolissoclinum pacificiensis L6]|uniref:Uncharacterized protein n=1 Tax=Candidatus Xenolissoclinum pacificiensis L6 TaxID=1401685 RepID=W2UYP3_9RICK|nr:MAG: hypothetical protein P857_706 [Candidatus Xenolissoclinum pacificiensis L6]
MVVYIFNTKYIHPSLANPNPPQLIAIMKNYFLDTFISQYIHP